MATKKKSTPVKTQIQIKEETPIKEEIKTQALKSETVKPEMSNADIIKVLKIKKAEHKYFLYLDHYITRGNLTEDEAIKETLNQLRQQKLI